MNMNSGVRVSSHFHMPEWQSESISRIRVSGSWQHQYMERLAVLRFSSSLDLKRDKFRTDIVNQYKLQLVLV
jgi:hypothetical protein